MRLLGNRLVFFLMFVCAGSPSRAGPPLTTEDPGILDRGDLEIISAVSATSITGGNTYQVPILDVSLGLITDKLQISAAFPYVFADPDDGSRESDFGNLELGLKWRFWDSGKLQVAFAPLFAFGVTRKTANLGIGDDREIALFPLTAEYGINDQWRLNASAGYASVNGGEDEWVYGAAVIYGLNERWELLFEFVGATNSGFDDDILDVRAGFDFAWTDNVHLLFSVATGLQEISEEEKLDYDIFFAVQFFR